MGKRKREREKNKIIKCHDRGSVGWGGCWVGLDWAVWSLFLGNWGGIGKGLADRVILVYISISLFFPSTDGRYGFAEFCSGYKVEKYR